QTDSVAALKNVICNLSYARIQVYRINNFYIIKLIHYPADRTENVIHGITKVFSSVRREKNHAVLSDPVKNRILIITVYSSRHCINRRIAGNIDILLILAFTKKILCADFGRSKMHICKTSYHLTIHFFRKWRILVPCTESCLNVPDRNLAV